MHVIVAGGGRLGEQVARALEPSDNQVVVVEIDPRRAAGLLEKGHEVVTGNACVAGVLEAAGALRADVLVACTGRDEENLVISQLAKRHLEVPRVVAMVNDGGSAWLFDTTWGVDAAISSAGALVALIEEATGTAQTIRLAELGVSGQILVEATVTGGSAARDHRIADLSLTKGDRIVAVVRRGRPAPLDNALRLRSGDRVLVVTGPEGEARVHHAFFPDTGFPDDGRPAVEPTAEET